MTNRRRFLISGGSLLALSAGGSYLIGQRRLPDGSAAKGMITPEAQDAIDRGLAYLVRHQHRDHSWGTGQYHGNVAITSIAALALMSGGHLPGRGRYGEAVQGALEYVLSQERRNPPGYLNNGAAAHGPMYGHGFGTLFLAEVYGMVHNENLRKKLKGTLQRAVQLIVRSQNIEGGWRYHPISTDADISVTICQIMALRAAKNAGFYVPKSTVDRCIDYVKRCQDLQTGGFRYMARHGGTAFARTAAGVVALYSAGVYEGKHIEAGLKYLMQHRPGRHFIRHDMHYFYGHYYAVQAMWTAGGEYWKNWFPAIRDDLLRSGRHKNAGYWFDPICTHYGTAMACLILQVPNNYLPIFQR
ncbi:MAG: hypothetical protein KatS3mg105_0513 [Gemmatales bacterium]|nr:MAG: hypothetical protein KatS3mg105_0513 [Gemmatales bacterium]